MDADGASFAEMNQPSTHPAPDPPALDEEAVERLLAGDLPRALAPPGYGEVAALLAATVAPPRPSELTGQAAALAELKAVARARSAAAPRQARKQPTRRRVGLAVAIVVGALATSGAAAATTSHLPGPIRDATRSILTTVGVTTPTTPTEVGRQPAPSTGNTGTAGATTDSQATSPTGAADRGSGPAAAALTGPAEDGLCRAFMAGQGAEQGKKIDAAAFKALADAAGGPDKIATYCQGTQPGNTKSDRHTKQTPPRGPGNQGQGQGGPPPSTGGGNQEHGGPPGTRPHSR
jgi:hypothetical protein